MVGWSDGLSTFSNFSKREVSRVKCCIKVPGQHRAICVQCTAADIPKCTVKECTKQALENELDQGSNESQVSNIKFRICFGKRLFS